MARKIKYKDYNVVEMDDKFIMTSVKKVGCMRKEVHSRREILKDGMNTEMIEKLRTLAVQAEQMKIMKRSR